MKAAPTLDGRIRIDIESPLDLMVLRTITLDARSVDDGLAERLARAMDGGELAADWREFVLGDLKEDFGGQLRHIERALSTLGDNPGQPLFIVADEAMAWYGGLNQARLALEERYRLAAWDSPDPLPATERSAWIRSHFYQTLQGLIFEHLIRD